MIHHRPVQFAIVAFAALFFLLGAAWGRATAAAPRTALDVPADAWRTVAPSQGLLEASDAPRPSFPVAASEQPTTSTTPALGTGLVASEPEPASPSPAALPARVPGGTLSATWYCNSDASRGPLSRCTRGYPDRRGVADLFVAVSPDLAFLRGRTFTVWRGSAHVTVRAIDCNCQARRALDLYGDAFARLASLGAGRITVVVR